MGQRISYYCGNRQHPNPDADAKAETASSAGRLRRRIWRYVGRIRRCRRRRGGRRNRPRWRRRGRLRWRTRQRRQQRRLRNRLRRRGWPICRQRLRQGGFGGGPLRPRRVRRVGVQLRQQGAKLVFADAPERVGDGERGPCGRRPAQAKRPLQPQNARRDGNPGFRGRWMSVQLRGHLGLHRDHEDIDFPGALRTLIGEQPAQPFAGDQQLFAIAGDQVP